MKLIALDVEGTIFKTRIRLPGTTIDSTIWQSLADSLGDKAVEEEVATHKKWSEGKYRTYIEWMQDTISIHRRHSLTQQVFQSVIDSAEYNEGAIEVLRELIGKGYTLVLVTGGFKELAARVQRDTGVIHAFAACEYLFDRQGILEGYNLLPCDFHGKLDFISLMLSEYGANESEWVFIGDGANDVPIANAAPISIGYCPHATLKPAVTHVVHQFHKILSLLQ